MPNILLIDGHNVAHRYFHGAPQVYVGGRPVNAVKGWGKLLVSFKMSTKFDKVVAIFDSLEPRERRADGYKGHRDPPDPELVSQLPMMINLGRLLGFDTYVSEGEQEGDDVIASLARLYESEEDKVFIYTVDKDLSQLVNDQIVWLRPAGMGVADELDVEGVQRKMGVLPEQVPLFLALAGDKSDNISGVDGIGEKTALKLIKRWPDLKEMIQACATGVDGCLNKRQRKNLIEDHDLLPRLKQVTLEPQQIPLVQKGKDLELAISTMQSLGLVTEAMHIRTYRHLWN